MNYLTLAYEGNYIAKVGPAEYFTYNGKVWVASADSGCACEVDAYFLFL